jgi:hypothetical protein
MGDCMILYFVKHNCPEILLLDIELSEVRDGAMEGHFKELMRTINQY